MVGEFTYDRYAELLETATEAGYEFLSVRDYLRRTDLPDRFVVLRHDVDRKPGNALDMARIEASAGAESTYYFRAVESTFDPEILTAIEDLGHEVGYHYEDLDRADGDVAAAHDLFASNLAAFREHVTVDTVSMHGNPLTLHDNRRMWDDRSFAEYGIDGEVYLSVDFTDVTYFTDTNRTWYDEKTVVNDWPVGDNGKSIQVETTTDLTEVVEAGHLDRLYLLAHPDRWTDSLPELAVEVSKDAVFNLGKLALWHARRLRGDDSQGETGAGGETRPETDATTGEESRAEAGAGGGDPRV